MVRGEAVDDLGLDGVGVLILVDEEVAKALAEVVGYLLVCGEELEPEFE